MTSQRLIRRILFMLGSALLPLASQAQITVLIGTDSNGFFTSSTQVLTGSPTVNLDCPPPTGTVDPLGSCIGTTPGPRKYNSADGGEFTITKSCTGSPLVCRSAPRPRVFVTDGAIDTMVLTDAIIKNVSPVTKTLHIRLLSGVYEAAGEPGPRRYAVEASGSWPSVVPVLDNKLRVTLAACYFNPFGGEGEEGTIVCDEFTEGPNPRMIDNPSADVNEEEGEVVSLAFPPYKPAQTTQFSNREEDGKECPSTNSELGTCIPALRMDIAITLAPNETIRLPGSIGAAGQKAICDPNDVETLPACERWYSFFATLGPKGAEIYEARLEPSPGNSNSTFVRGIQNSSDVWVSRRGEHDDVTKNGAGANISKTKVKLNSNGTGEVTAQGLCSVNNGCEDAVVPVRVFCGQSFDPVFVTSLKLNSKGDGSAELLTTMPCTDPAVLIMHPTIGGAWVAAPVIF